MADPKDKVRFVSSNPDDPVREITGVRNALTGDTQDIKFKDGAFETTDPGLIPSLIEHGKVTGLFKAVKR